MRHLTPRPEWPESWKMSHTYDQVEIWGSTSNLGYTYAYAERKRRALDLCRQHKPPPASALDVAAAQGNFSLALAEAGYDVTWNDLRSDLVGYVELKGGGAPPIHFEPKNVFDLDGRYDLILATEIIEHVAHVDRFLQQLRKLLTSDGVIVLTTPNGRYLKNRLPKFSDCPDPSVFESVQFKPNSDGHIFLLHPNELRELAERAGLRVVTLETYTTSLTAGHVGTHRILPFLPRSIIRLMERASYALPRSARERMHTNMAAAMVKA